MDEETIKAIKYTASAVTFFNFLNEQYNTSSGEDSSSEESTTIDQDNANTDVNDEPFPETETTSDADEIKDGIDDIFQCLVCLEMFLRRNIKKHMRRHAEQGNECPICDKKIAKKDGFKLYRRMHVGMKPLQLDPDNKRFVSKKTLANRELHECDVCQKKFTLSALKVHKRTHTNDRPYECDICQRRFNRKESLTRHKYIHKGYKPYKCDICNKKFVQKSGLATHNRTHTGEKPYACNICHTRFNRTESLKRHKRLHSGQKT